MRAHTRASMRCQNANNLCDRALDAAAHLQKNYNKTNKHQIYGKNNVRKMAKMA